MKEGRVVEKTKQTPYKVEYAKAHYRRIPLDVSIQTAERWKAAADAAGKPLNAFIKEAVEAKIEQDGRESPE